MSDPVRRPPGRPATENLGRFYLSTGLLAHPKALKLRRELALEDREVYLLVARLFDYAASFAGSSGHIPRSEYGALAAFCFWDGDPFLLVSAFRRAGFVDNEGDVHGWLEFQPDAQKRASRRKKPNESNYLNAIQETDTPTTGQTEPPVIMDNLTPQNSEPPSNILESLIPQNSQNSQGAVNTEQAENGENLAQDLLSQRDTLRATVTLPAHVRARESGPNSSLGQKVEALLADLATRSGQAGPKLGPLAHLAELVFRWAEIPEPTAGQLARLRLAVAQIGPEGVERLVRDFRERGYEPTDRLSALCGAARREFDGVPSPAGQQPENTPHGPQDTPNGTGEGK